MTVLHICSVKQIHFPQGLVVITNSAQSVDHISRMNRFLPPRFRITEKGKGDKRSCGGRLRFPIKILPDEEHDDDGAADVDVGGGGVDA